MVWRSLHVESTDPGKGIHIKAEKNDWLLLSERCLGFLKKDEREVMSEVNTKWISLKLYYVAQSTVCSANTQIVMKYYLGPESDGDFPFFSVWKITADKLLRWTFCIVSAAVKGVYTPFRSFNSTAEDGTQTGQHLGDLRRTIAVRLVYLMRLPCRLLSFYSHQPPL